MTNIMIKLIHIHIVINIQCLHIMLSKGARLSYLGGLYGRVCDIGGAV